MLYDTAVVEASELFKPQGLVYLTHHIEAATGGIM